MKIEGQYYKDDAFKKEARLHQTLYRKNVLKVGYKDYGNRLLDKDAELNYYPKLEVLKDLRYRYPNYSKKRDADMLRSEHIPFNVFSPLKLNFELAKNTFNELLGNIISEITDIKIENAPKPKDKYLNDGTSFDTIIEFKHIDSSRGALGIEVKYTEQSYTIGDIEKNTIENPNSLYYSVTKKSDLYLENSISDLIKDDFRQIWRNHILGESIKQNNELEHFISITLYPAGNTHFNKIIPEYLKLLKPDKQQLFKAITYEELFDAYTKLNNTTEFSEWIEFLKKRYIVNSFILNI